MGKVCWQCWWLHWVKDICVNMQDFQYCYLVFCYYNKIIHRTSEMAFIVHKLKEVSFSWWPLIDLKHMLDELYFYLKDRHTTVCCVWCFYSILHMCTCTTWHECTHVRTYLMHTFLRTSQFIIPLCCSIMLYIVTHTFHFSAAWIIYYLLSSTAKLSEVPDY